ncbi:hypothetical protein SAMN02799624_05780 [Paenibacillus sp. UNC496MF]|uniref:hypothetical protein n=1 Tax=Paenibacillus sp. UNC496MF TaxID=1502753 RepID=UPI0008E48E3F|nr:hypothetical protein [Paenibacillus sp. UNC496MF]SFJ74283.1 hypothetical protein SAMN02799624_05780 [Paenibacillus sp. UNC496MF]
MPYRLVDEFIWMDWNDIDKQQDEQLTAADKYNRIVGWAGKARGKNPGVFDELTGWLMDDSEWTEEKLAENEQILVQGVLARFQEQNARLRLYLKELEPSGVVNAPVFKALDDFDRELSGVRLDARLSQEVTRMFTDFTTMRERNVREQVAGGKTGQTGTDSVDVYGYINHLKNCDAQVQWCLFMPDMVKRQQAGFKVDNFEYKQMPAMRFIGVDDRLFHSDTDEEYHEKKKASLKNVISTLHALTPYKSGFDHDVLLGHHYGRGVDVEPWHGFWGRFMKADTPVPEGFMHVDFTSEYADKPGPPYLSKFAFATFSGDIDAMHDDEGTDGGRMYDVTRNIILGQGVGIPYPDKYWIAEVFLDGFDKPSTAYMFSVVL